MCSRLVRPDGTDWLFRIVKCASGPFCHDQAGLGGHIADTLEDVMPKLREKVVLPGAGHWTQKEHPTEVNGLLLEFLAGLDTYPRPTRWPKLDTLGVLGRFGPSGREWV